MQPLLVYKYKKQEREPPEYRRRNPAKQECKPDAAAPSASVPIPLVQHV